MTDVAWTVFIEDINPATEALSVPDVRPAVDPRRWWSGSGNLDLEGHTWNGSDMGDTGSLIEVSGAQWKVGYPGRRARFRLACPRDAARRLLEVDMGGVRIELGWLYRHAGGAWTRIPRRFRGRLSNTEIVAGVLTGNLETVLGDADRSTPKKWSHEAQISENPGDNAFSMASELAGDYDFRWNTR